MDIISNLRSKPSIRNVFGSSWNIVFVLYFHKTVIIHEDMHINQPELSGTYQRNTENIIVY